MRPLIAIVVLLNSVSAFAGQPECDGIQRWATKMAFVHLKNAGLTDGYKVDYPKTQTTRLASEKMGEDLYQQVHKVIFTEKSGKIITVITNNQASNVECSMTGVEVYLVTDTWGKQ